MESAGHEVEKAGAAASQAPKCPFCRRRCGIVRKGGKVAATCGTKRCLGRLYRQRKANGLSVGDPGPQPGEVLPGSPAEGPNEGPNWYNRDLEAKARMHELELAKKSGDLVPAKDVAAKLAEVFGQCRTKILAITVRARQRIPKLTDADAVILDGLVRETLTSLADGA